MAGKAPKYGTVPGTGSSNTNNDDQPDTDGEKILLNAEINLVAATLAGMRRLRVFFKQTKIKTKFLRAIFLKKHF